MSRLIALRAAGLLVPFSEAGVLAPADVHVAQRLGALAGEPDDRVLLTAALTVRSTRNGSVVFDLAGAEASIVADPDDPAATELPALPWPQLSAWVQACAASPLVTGAAGGPPLRMVGTRLWLDRYWGQEVQVADDLGRRSHDRPADLNLSRLQQDLDQLFAGGAAPDQRRAVDVAARSRVSVIAGGPGTGKTTTVAQLITVLRRGLGPDTRIALAAPTGKAAARLTEAVQSARGPLTEADRVGLAGLSASTLHRLLGWRPGSSSRFRYDRDNHLPYDVVVVDESSMVSLTLMARLLEALAPATRLVLVGDPDQLASVEAGAVLGDLVAAAEPVQADPPAGESTATAPSAPESAASALSAAESTATAPAGAEPAGPPGAGLRESVVRLGAVYRFGADTAIAELATLIRLGRGDQALDLLRARPQGVAFHEVADTDPVTGTVLAGLRARMLGHERELISAATAGDVEAALAALDRHRVLCAHRSGPRGVRHWSEFTDQWLSPYVRPRGDGRYAGQPLMVTYNDYEIELFNGDTGVVVRDGDELTVAFGRGGSIRLVPLVRLGEVRELHAMTVHRAQGSQFDSVTVLMPTATSPLATRQTLYTAVTRAVNEVHLIGSVDSLLACAHRPAARATGLRERLSAQPPARRPLS